MAVEVVVDAPEACAVMAERGKLRQALLNVLKNAFEAMPEGGRVGFVVRPRAEITERVADGTPGSATVEIEVWDEGKGLDPAMRDDAFRPFKTTKHAGTGLGLSIVARTFRAHGGSVKISNRAEGGARVVMRLVPAS